MKKLLAAATMVVFAASMAFAAAPETVSFKCKNGDVTMSHVKHAPAGSDCKVCHGEGAPAKVKLGKDNAHKVCKACHEAKKAGPLKCGECHKK